MAINIILYLVIIALFGLLKFRLKYDLFFSWIMSFFIVLLFIGYGYQALTDNVVGFSFLWNSSKIGNITIDFHPSIAINQLILPVFFISTVAIFNGNVFRSDENNCSSISLIVLNFISLCLLICSENYIQLITAVFMSDILGYLFIKDVDSSHRFVIYNLVADMGLFMILALACGKINSLEISELISYRQIGMHKDFVGLMTLIVILIKMGVFPFHGYLLNLSETRFPRINITCLLFSPMAGILILLKLHHLLSLSDLSVPLLQIFSLISLIVGAFYFPLKDNIKQKIVYLNMSLWGFILYVLCKSNFTWNYLFSYFLIVMYFIYYLFYKIHIFQNNLVSIREMLGNKRREIRLLKLLLVQFVLLTNIFYNILYLIYQKNSETIVLVFGLVFFAGLIIILNHIYRSLSGIQYKNNTKNSPIFLAYIVNTGILLFGCRIFNTYMLQNIIFTFIFLSCISLAFISKLQFVYNVAFIQRKSLSNLFFFYTIEKPFRYLSRKLLLTFDFVFSERITNMLFTTLNRQSIALFFKFNRKNNATNVFFILLGILIFILSFYWRIR